MPTTEATTTPDFGRCTCHDVRAFNHDGSVFGSLASFGAECGACISANDYYDELYRRESMTEAERVAEDIATRWFVATDRLRRTHRRPGAPILPDLPF